MYTPMTNTDGYKLTHAGFMLKNTTKLLTNMTARSFKYAKVPMTESVFFNLQAVIKKILIEDINREFFSQPVDSVIARMARRFNAYAGRDVVSTDHMRELHELGYLPLEIWALPEGSKVPEKVPYYIIFNTHPDFAWVVNYFETVMSSHMWHPITTATTMYHFRKMVNKFAMQTVGNTDATGFQLHDFSYRGLPGTEAAAASGAAFLLSSFGTDTLPAIDYLEQYYNADCEKELIAMSVPACYDSETEVLTDRGFVKFQELSETDLVAQYKDTGSIDFVKPTAYYNMAYTGDMVHWKSTKVDNVDLLVTPNHKMVRYSRARGTISLFEAGDTSYHVGSGYSAKNWVVVSGEATGFVNEPKNLSPLDKLRIAFQADGAFPSRKEAYKSGQIRFQFKKKRKADRLESILKEIGVDYSINLDCKDYYTFWINPENSFSLEKNLDWVELTKPKEWYEEFIQELSHWDGTIKNNCIVYSSTERHCADIVQTIAPLAGYKAKWSVERDYRDSNRKDLYVICLSKKLHISGESVKRSVVQYTGTVHCVSVPSKMLVVRRNNKVAICGNTEHALASLGIAVDGEEATLRRWITEDYPTGIVSIISDTKDFWNVITNTASNLKEAILARQPNEFGLAKTVFRPDSGDPVKVITGYTPEEFTRKVHTDGTTLYFDKATGKQLSLAEIKGAVECLWDIFGGTKTEKGYDLLHERVGLIYGDSITYEIAKETSERLKAKCFASTNVVYGIGSFMLQYVTRDTLGMALKATYAEVDGIGYDLEKDPVTDSGVKKSAKGFLNVQYDGRRLLLVQGNQAKLDFEAGNTAFRKVFSNSVLLIDESLQTIRDRLWNN